MTDRIEIDDASDHSEQQVGAGVGFDKLATLTLKRHWVEGMRAWALYPTRRPIEVDAAEAELLRREENLPVHEIRVALLMLQRESSDIYRERLAALEEQLPTTQLKSPPEGKQA